MATEQTIKAFKERLADAIKTPLDQLLSNPTMWGPINFEPARPDLGRALDMMNQLSVLPIDILPEQTASVLSNQVEGMRTLIEELRKFTIEAGGDPNARKLDLINRIKAHSGLLLQTESVELIPMM